MSALRIWAETNGVKRRAYKVGGLTYDCYPPSANEKTKGKSLHTIEEAAAFLTSHPGWGIRMNPGTAIIYSNIQF
jgi:hypothetical protein